MLPPALPSTEPSLQLPLPTMAPLLDAEASAHELTNVLQIIRGYVAFAHKNLAHESDHRGDLEQALIATDRAAKIAHQMLETARTPKPAEATE